MTTAKDRAAIARIDAMLTGEGRGQQYIGTVDLVNLLLDLRSILTTDTDEPEPEE